jgi:Bacterial Ig domain
MASAKSSPTRRGGGTSTDREQAISPARWAGVSLVIAAIVAAIVLAMVSGSDPSEPTDPVNPAIIPAGSSAPSSAPIDPAALMPKGQPRIVNPVSETTSEVDFPMTVELPAEDLRPKDLDLIIVRGNEKVGEYEHPKPGESVVVPSVRVDEGENVLVAILRGPGGLGPPSEPITLIVDRSAKQLAITAPANKTTVYDDTVIIEGTADAGARVEIVNETTGDPAVTETVGNSGTFDASIKLKPNATNKITASTTDDAGLTPS